MTNINEMTAEESTRIMSDKSHPLNERFWAGDPEVAKTVSQGFENTHGTAPAVSPSGQSETLITRPETMSPEAQFSPEDQELIRTVKAELREKHWGDKTEENYQFAGKVARHIFSDQLELIQEAAQAIGDDVLAYRLLYAIGKKFNL